MSDRPSKTITCIWRDGCSQSDKCQAAECCQGLARNREQPSSKQCAECARYESGREALCIVIDTQRDKIRQLELAERLNVETVATLQQERDMLKKYIATTAVTGGRTTPPPSERMSELERAAMHYVEIVQTHRSPYITENGRHQDSGGPWAELVDAVQDQAKASETKPEPPAAPLPLPPDEAHTANEWADMATNGLQWLRNIRDGISTAEEACAEMQSNYIRIMQLRQPMVRRQGPSPTKASARTHDPAMAMLPNDHHPGPRCSCRACLGRYQDEKIACRCPTDWCRLEPDNGAQYCPALGPNEFCAQGAPETDERVGYWCKFKNGVKVWIGPMTNAEMLATDATYRHNFSTSPPAETNEGHQRYECATCKKKFDTWLIRNQHQETCFNYQPPSDEAL